jgi:hypothetical protein
MALKLSQKLTVVTQILQKDPIPGAGVAMGHDPHA